MPSTSWMWWHMLVIPVLCGVEEGSWRSGVQGQTQLLGKWKEVWAQTLSWVSYINRQKQVGDLSMGFGSGWYIAIRIFLGLTEIAILINYSILKFSTALGVWLLGTIPVLGRPGQAHSSSFCFRAIDSHCLPMSSCPLFMPPSPSPLYCHVLGTHVHLDSTYEGKHAICVFLIKLILFKNEF